MKILAVLALASFAHANVINYSLENVSETKLRDCVERTLEELMETTCLFFQQIDKNDDGSYSESDVYSFMEGSNCAYQAENRTVHLEGGCISDDVCLELVGRMLGVNQPKEHITRNININYNCTEKCTVECLHGGSVTADCGCACGYGFTGERCEKLKRESTFTDPKCGIVTGDAGGHISLSTYPSERVKSTFCQWLIKSDDPWTVIDAEIVDLGLDNVNVNPGATCNDMFFVYGAQDIKEPIPCDHSQNITHIHSTHNWLLFELRTNPFSEQVFTGPKIRYSTRKVQPGVRIYSEGMSSSAATMLVSSFFLALLCLV